MQFLEQQNQRVRSYSDEFSRTSSWYGAICVALLGFPFGVWTASTRPSHWALVAGLSAALAGAVALAVLGTLRATARSYYKAAAGVLVLEKNLGLHSKHVDGGDWIHFVPADRRSDAAKTVDHLFAEYCKRLTLWHGWTSRMGLTVKLFGLFSIGAAIESAVLLVLAFLGTNLLSWIAKAG
jgi:hypothetical protein